MNGSVDGPLPPHHDNCLGCGPSNTAGFGLSMRREHDLVIGEATLSRHHEGAPGLAHGGAVATLLDDLFGGVLMILDRPAVTANLSVDYRAPVPLGVPLTACGWCEAAEGRKLRMRGSLHAGDAVLAEASALFVAVDVAHFEAGGTSLPAEWLAWGTNRTSGS